MPLAERDDALASVDALLEDACAGRGRLVVLDGPPGIGKTRLLAAIHERADAAGMQVLRARAGELEHDFPFGVVRQLFEPSLGGSARAELLSGAAELAGPVFEVSAELPGADPAYSTLHGLYWLTVNLLEAAPARPVLLSVDDLHWCDPASLRYLAYLVRRLDGLSVLAVATMRPRVGAEPSVIDEIADSPDATVLRLAPLSGDGVTTLLSAHFGADIDPEFSSSVSEWTAGNPLLLRELIAAAVVRRIDPTAAGARQIRELAPEGVGRLVLRRIAPLGPHSRTVAEAVAVLGDDAELSRTAELAGLARADAARSVSALRGIDVLAPGDPPAFTHPLVRRAIYDDMDIARREALHATAAEMLAAAGAAPSRIVRHLVAVGPRGDGAVVAALRAAAREAMAQSASDAAVTYLARALEEPPADADRDAVTLELGLAQTRASPADAVPHLMQVIDSTEDDALLAEATIALTAAPREGYGEWTSIALDVMDRITDEKPRKRIQAHYALFGGSRPDEFPMVMRLLDAIDVREGSRDPVDLVLLALKASLAAREGAQPEDALALARAALADDVLAAYDYGAFGLTFSVVLHLDLFDEALRIAEDLIALSRRAGFLSAFMFGTLLKAMVLLGCGDLAGAETEMPIAVDPNPVRLTGMRPGSQTLGQIALHRGDLVAAAEHLDYPEESEEPGSWGSAINRGRRGVLRAAQGRLDAGLGDLQTAGAWLTALGGRNPAFFPWRSEAALVLARLDRRDEARDLAHEEVELARRWGAPRALGGALCSAGLVTGGGDGIDLLGEAAAVLEGSPAALARARATTELGAALRRSNRRADARAPLAIGLELAERCGATALAERAHEELIATGARPRRVARTGVDALTATELRVARMAAEGMTNREVAQALFVTPKTVEYHLSHAYSKLGLKSRSQLRAALAQAR
jgi:DNA-binding CsgD family transcriptional regulator